MATSRRSGSSPARRRGSAASGPRRRSRAATASPRRRATRPRSTTSPTATATRSCRCALDVTDKAAVDAAVAQAHEHFGRLDVVVNNAGYGLFGMVEEVSEEQARAQIETNLFGALWVTQAALPLLREQGSGHIVQVSSIGGVQAFAGLGLYHASKWALEAFSQSLALEVAGFGIKVTIVEPTGYSTDWPRPSSAQAEHLPAYAEARRAAEESRRARVAAPRRPRGDRPGDPRGRRCRRAAAADLLRQRAAGHHPRRVRAPDRDVGALGRALAPRTRKRGVIEMEQTGAHHDAVRLRVDRRRGVGGHRPDGAARDRHGRRVRHRRRDRPCAGRRGRARDARGPRHGRRRAHRAGHPHATGLRRARAAPTSPIARRRGVRARLGRPAAPARQQRRRDGAARADALRRGPRAAVRDQPPRALRARTRPPRGACGRRAPRDRRRSARAGTCARRWCSTTSTSRSARTTRGSRTGSPRPPTCCSRSGRASAGPTTASPPTR